MHTISGATHRRQFSLGGLPAVLAAIAFVVVSTAVMLVVSLFGAAVWSIRKGLTSLLNLFGAAGGAEKIPVMHGRPTIEMHRDESGSWRRD